ncbi:TfuA-like protein [Rhizobium sp. S152]|uniref:TfuA-like protein n=1 Tax=Rhizobium sp. S152 TaxID=3055038 RepID=UPI0025A93A28|nr:TfuA-like protein [Rhizobium sp. S152]MDM9625516.1 TfuA-like protein [Rhizobium sp. S152]
MRVVFVGPSLPDAVAFSESRIDIRPPAVQGDVLRAVRDGATVIGIVDGGFEYTAPIWHKEILHALSQNVTIFGAASMGALRAAECQAFGMMGIGRIFKEYASGVTVDDADVALLHGPAELGCKPLTLPLVNVRSTLDHLEDAELISHQLRVALQTAAASLFFKRRSWRSVVSNCGPGLIENAEVLLELLVTGTIDQKRIDALALVEAVLATPEERSSQEVGWKLHQTFLFRSGRT